MAVLRPEQKSLKKQEVENKTIWWLAMLEPSPTASGLSLLEKCA